MLIKLFLILSVSMHYITIESPLGIVLGSPVSQPSQFRRINLPPLKFNSSPLKQMRLEAWFLFGSLATFQGILLSNFGGVMESGYEHLVPTRMTSETFFLGYQSKALPRASILGWGSNPRYVSCCFSEMMGWVWHPIYMELLQIL